MRLKIQHATHYAYDAAPSYLVQRLYLMPVNFEGQRTISWTISAPGIETSLSHKDGFGNVTHLVTVRGHSGVLTIAAEGELFAQRLRSPEAMEAFQAFFQKRKPDFSAFS